MEHKAEKAIETSPLKELSVDKTLVLVHDLDDSLRRRREPVGTARTKVTIEQKITNNLAQETDLSILKTIVTGRPAKALLTKPALREFLNMQSIIQKDGRQVHLPLSVVFCELGAVALKRTKTDWQPEVVPYFQTYCNETRQKLHDWLKEKYVDTEKYKFEEGTLVSLSLQSLDDQPLDKEKLAAEIKAAWKKENQTDFQNEVSILTEGADVDFYPSVLTKGGKVHGLTEVLNYFREFLPDLQWKNIIFADDSGGQASRTPALLGASIIAPANSNQKMKIVIKALNAGYVSIYDQFIGIMDGLKQVIANHPLAKNKPLPA